jgi:hypothetical protein
MATKEFLRQLEKISPLNVGGEKYHLVFHEKRWRLDGSPGTVNFPHAKIYLDTSLENNRIIAILNHELLEIINDKYSLELPHPILCVLENTTTEILRDNKEYRELLPKYVSDYTGNNYDFKDFTETEELQIEETPMETKDPPTTKSKKKAKKK